VKTPSIEGKIEKKVEKKKVGRNKENKKKRKRKEHFCGVFGVCLDFNSLWLGFSWISLASYLE
jgi:hypothetical protein